MRPLSLVRHLSWVIRLCLIQSCAGKTEAKIVNADGTIITPDTTRSAQRAICIVNEGSATDIDFIGMIDSVSETGQIYLQRVAKSDSAGPYIRKEFISDSLSFRMLFYPKHGDKKDVTFSTFYGSAKRNFDDMICSIYLVIHKP